MQREGLVHHGIKFRFGDRLHHFDFKKLVGKVVTVYGQQEVVKDFIARQLADGVRILFDVEDVSIRDFDSTSPKIGFRHDGQPQELDCDFIGGCDGFHGITRESIPAGVLTTYERDYPFGWLGILSQSAPPDEELIYSYHERGFALYTMRSPTLARLYFQCAPEEDIEKWPDERVWQEFQVRLGGARELSQGEIVQKSITPMRSFMVEPMQYGRLFLAGDAAHIVPPTGAKGMNLAFADVRLLARAIAAFYRTASTELLDRYSSSCLRRAWKAQRFSWWMTQLLHLFPGDTPFAQRRQIAELDYLAGSHAASTALAENYVGLPVD
jgi:p-hydroxybenzoate 3-monooxygenase